MQYRILDRRTLQYKDGGYVREWSIDNDYINSNNSTIDIVFAATNANVGDVIFLIETSGAYDKGIITAIDNEDLKISYKGDKELFNDNIINPLTEEFEDDTEISVAGVFDLDVVATLIDFYWGKNIDPCKRIPISSIQTSGSANIYWTWQDTQINFTEWLISLFKDYYIFVSFDIDFDTGYSVERRNPTYIISISAVSNDNDIIKDNVATQTITYTKESLPEKTCCWVIDKESKSVVTVVAGKNKFNGTYGVAEAILDEYGKAIDQSNAGIKQNSNVSSYIKINGSQSYVLSWINGDNVARNISFYDNNGNVITFNDGTQNTTFLQYSGVSGYFSFTTPSNARKVRICYAVSAKNIQFETGNTPTAYEVYSYKAIYYLCVNSTGSDIVVNGETVLAGEYYITPDYNDGNRILPVRTVYVEYDAQSATNNMSVVDIAKNELKLSSLNHAIEIEIPRDTKMFDFELAKYGDRYRIITKNGTITSIYSGRKESSETNVVTLLFGIGRLNFTDLIKETLRNSKYSKIYSKQV